MRWHDSDYIRGHLGGDATGEEVTKSVKTFHAWEIVVIRPDLRRVSGLRHGLVCQGRKQCRYRCGLKPPAHCRRSRQSLVLSPPAATPDPLLDGEKIDINTADAEDPDAAAGNWRKAGRRISSHTVLQTVLSGSRRISPRSRGLEKGRWRGCLSISRQDRMDGGIAVSKADRIRLSDWTGIGGTHGNFGC